MEWSPSRVHGLRGNEFWSFVAIELDVPSLAVHNDVMVFTQQAHIAEIVVAVPLVMTQGREQPICTTGRRAPWQSLVRTADHDQGYQSSG